ncbi:MAG: Rieske (2Fe-2S) protein [Chloroflexi bacterium]|nr:Rieske (2Fe-2S) protein [Chloroflexota bacterium]
MNEATQVSNLSRRRFLALLTHGGWMAALGVSLYQIGRFLDAEGLPNTPSLLVEAGKLADFPPGSTTYVAAARAWLRNDAGYLTALDAVCPHLGCLVQQKITAVSGFQCPCHGSHFGAAGELEQGPAERPLRTLTVQTRPDDTVIILIAD